MTEIIRLEIKGITHAIRQRPDERYALFCEATVEGGGINCKSINTLGHLGDFADYEQAKIGAAAHPHSAVISFYPYIDEEDHEIGPSRQFLKDFRNQAEQPPRR